MIETAVTKRFEALIRERGGLSLRPQEVPALQKTLRERRLSLKLPSPEAYLDLLAGQTRAADQEWKQLWERLTNQESYFFRDADQLGVISSQIWPDLARRNRETRTLRVWSAGCSTGEEPYSIAMMLDEDPRFRDWRISIFATDLSEAALERARRGLYGEWSFRALDAERRARYFTPRGNAWEVAPLLRRRVSFATGNLFADPFPSSEGPHDLDLIVCRNVFIYFDRAAVAQVLKKFSAALRPGGFLVCGHAELHDVPLGDLEARSFPQSVVYQRAAGTQNEAKIPARAPIAASLSTPIPAPISTLSPKPRPTMEREARPASPFPPRPTRQALPNPSLNEMVSPGAVARRLAPLPSIPIPATKSPVSNEAAEILERAKTEMRVGRAAAGVKMVESLLEEQPEFFAGWCWLAQAQADAGSLDPAQNSCERALKGSPMAALPYLILARIAEERGAGEEAKALLKKVMYLSPDSVWAPLELSAIYRREGDSARAAQMQRAALAVLENRNDDAPVPAEEHAFETLGSVGDLKRQLRAELETAPKDR